LSSPVSHHDTEIPFNPSFIEPPSAAWVSDSSFSSFDTDNEGPEYSVPPKEGDVHACSSSPRLSSALLGCLGSILLRYRPWVSQGWVLGTSSNYFHTLIFLGARTHWGRAWPHVMGRAWCGQLHFTTSSHGNAPRDNPVASATVPMSPSVLSPNSRPLLLQASRCWGGLSCRMGRPPPAGRSRTHPPLTPRMSRSPSPSLAPPALPRPSGPLCPLLRGRNLGQQRPPALGGSPRPHGAHPSCPHRQGTQQLRSPLNDQPAIAMRALSPLARGRKATGHRPAPPRGDAGGWCPAPGTWPKEWRLLKRLQNPAVGRRRGRSPTSPPST